MDRMSNPIATEAQHALELKALQLIQHPKLVQTKAEVRDYWLGVHNPVGEMRACFDRAFEEVMFAAVVWSLNQDPLYPEVITITRLPHKLKGHDIPGTRWGLDNPDTVYRVIPISGAEKYVIEGRVAEQRMTENYFTLWDKQMRTVDVLNGKDLVLDQHGRFTISVDSEPANGRPNHVRSSNEAHEFYIRDVMLDWDSDRINELSIRRLGGAPARPPFSEAEQLELTASYLWKWAKDTDRWNAQVKGKPVNQFEFTIDRETDGALRNQIYVLGEYLLATDNDALVFTVELGGAEYFIAPITNPWGTTNDILHRTGSLNKAQSVPNADGTYTFVVSLKDPGVHNWIDPCGLRSGILTLRWAEFPDTGARRVAASSKLVPLGELPRHLPEGTRFVTAQERQRQLERRAAAYQWRLLEA